MDDDPQLKGIDQLLSCSIAIEQTLVVLLEAHPGFAALIAARVSADPDVGAMRFEDCTHFRRTGESRYQTRRYQSVQILKDRVIRHWIASPDEFRSVFSQPSADAYAVVQLSELTSRALNQALQLGDYDAVYMMIRVRFAALPKFFSPNPRELQGAANYASGRDALQGRYQLIE